jgi:methylmalonyl-CoA/ethylmalonyl-CoA epimerase
LCVETVILATLIEEEFPCLMYGIRLLLGIPEKPEFDHPSSIVYFRVENIEQTYESLLARGVNFDSKPHKVAEFNGFAVWMAFFRDPDRNVHALTSEVPVA